MSSARPALALAALLVAACKVGPNYQAPTPPTPKTSQFVAAGPVAASLAQPPDNWWRLYDAPPIDALVQQALTHNKSLLEAAANLAEARGALDLARAGLFPSTNISGGAQYGVSSTALLLRSVEGAPGAPSPGAAYTAGLDVSYEVDFFGRVRRTIEAARVDVAAQQAAEDVARVSVAAETTRAYVDACAFAEEYDVGARSLDIATQTADITEREFRDGSASALDLARAREAEEQVRATLPTIEGQRLAALFSLAVLTGDPPEEISKDAEACRTTPKLGAVLPVGDVGALFRRRPDVREAERQLAGNVARIGVATADLYPTITLNANVSTAATSLAGLGSLRNLSYLLGPLFSWSFPNTLVAQAEVREAKGTASASYANFQATVLQALQDTETALATYANELVRNRALVAARDQSRTAFTLAKDQYLAGAIGYLDFITAENDLINAEAQLAASDQTLASDQVTVFKALGGGWEQAPPVAPLPIRDAKTGRDIPVK